MNKTGRPTLNEGMTQLILVLLSLTEKTGCVPDVLSLTPSDCIKTQTSLYGDCTGMDKTSLDTSSVSLFMTHSLTHSTSRRT